MVSRGDGEKESSERLLVLLGFGGGGRLAKVGFAGGAGVWWGVLLVYGRGGREGYEEMRRQCLYEAMFLTVVNGLVDESRLDGLTSTHCDFQRSPDGQLTTMQHHASYLAEGPEAGYSYECRNQPDQISRVRVCIQVESARVPPRLTIRAEEEGTGGRMYTARVTRGWGS